VRTSPPEARVLGLPVRDCAASTGASSSNVNGSLRLRGNQSFFYLGSSGGRPASTTRRRGRLRNGGGGLVPRSRPNLDEDARLLGLARSHAWTIASASSRLVKSSTASSVRSLTTAQKSIAAGKWRRGALAGSGGRYRALSASLDSARDPKASHGGLRPATWKTQAGSATGHARRISKSSRPQRAESWSALASFRCVASTRLFVSVRACVSSPAEAATADCRSRSISFAALEKNCSIRAWSASGGGRACS
jgi:hypothetical protein